uniref:Maelstrom spermatogenic transposon silencer n=1 Tax=Sphenodon punctatus TaxID=8508 RepID=A0A8D0HQD7_SPHPU
MRHYCYIKKFTAWEESYLLSCLTLLCMCKFSAMIRTVFYFMNIFSHGELPPHCEQRYLPCEIGCVKYSLQDGIIADFHCFIDPGEVPRGFRFHCQTASDATHKIPISCSELSNASYSVVLRGLYSFIQPRGDMWPPVYCKSEDWFRVNWCLKRMAKESDYTLDLVVKLYYQKLQKEPSKTWVCNQLDVFMWDYSSNTRCKWHEENDILFCALASCKKIAYCISNSLASMYGIALTTAHLPLQDYNSSNTKTPKMVVLDAGRFQVSFYSNILSSTGQQGCRVELWGSNLKACSVRGRGSAFGGVPQSSWGMTGAL